MVNGTQIQMVTFFVCEEKQKMLMRHAIDLVP